MADKDRDVWQAPRNAGVGALADALAAGKRGLNYVDLLKLLAPPVPAYANRDNIQYERPDTREPKLGLGSLLLGEAPEEIDRWSYGDSPFVDNYYGTAATAGRLKPDRRFAMLDTALLPVAETVGAAKLAGRGATKVAEKAGLKSLPKDAARVEKSVDTGRRATLKGLAAVPAATAAAHVAPKLLEKTAAKDVEEAAGKAATKAVVHATPEEFSKVVNDIMDRSRFEADEYSHKSDERAGIAEVDFPKKFVQARDKLLSNVYKKYDPEVVDSIYNTMIIENGRFPYASEVYYLDRVLDKYHKLSKDPRFAPYVDYMRLGGQRDLRADLNTPDHPIHQKIKHKASGGPVERTTHDRKLI